MFQMMHGDRSLTDSCPPSNRYPRVCKFSFLAIRANAAITFLVFQKSGSYYSPTMFARLPLVGCGAGKSPMRGHY